ncbi:4-hydroxybenzoate octaprenyltransferase [Sulfolobales archaeon HS-7]|nr:4-hydroxybenzoate octaprenyltransferase [Sulfolobales archaeon HS-7]
MAWDPGGLGGNKGKLYVIMKFLRIEQTFFSLPMAYLGAFVALRGIPTLRILILVFVSLFFLRIAGMTNDNLADRDIDSRNPRTKNRPLVTGAITVREAKIMIAIGLIGFFVSTYFINFWALLFSPLVAGVTMSYPYMKRITSLANYHLASIQALAVFGGAVAGIGGDVSSFTTLIYRLPWFFIVATVFWAVGFDLYNHIPDEDFDREMGLHSFAVTLGKRALAFAGLNQVASVTLAFVGDYWYSLGAISYLATLLHGLIMLRAYAYATSGNFGKAFYFNIYSSIVLGLGVILDVILGFPRIL